MYLYKFHMTQKMKTQRNKCFYASFDDEQTVMKKQDRAKSKTEGQ